MKLRQIHADSSTLHDVAIAIKRFENCVNDVPDLMSRSNTQYKMSNSVFYGYNLYNLMQHVINNGNEKGYVGTILKALDSKDNINDKCFLFSCSGSPIEISEKPVILMIPYALDGNSFIKSWYLSSLDQIFIDKQLAFENGFSIAWPFLNGSEYNINDAENEIREVIEKLNIDYNINTNNIYLDGDCVGGFRALLLASRSPDLFAGVATHGPITQGSENNVPINLVRNLINVPTCIVHGEDDKVVPINHSLQYIKEAQKFGFSPDLIVKTGGKYSITKAYHTDSFQKLKEYFETRKRSIPNVLKYCSYEKYEKILYWISITPINSSQLAELSIEFNNEKKEFHLYSDGIKAITINTKDLNIKAGEKIMVSNNGKVIFEGKTEKDSLKLYLV